MAGPVFFGRAAWVSMSVRRWRPAIRMLVAAGTLIGLSVFACMVGFRCAAPKVARLGASVHDELIAGDCAVLDAKHLSDCGWVGITERACLAKGCCFKDMGWNSEVPWCFKKTLATIATAKKPSWLQCNVPRPERVQCGFAGIAKEQCNQRGCCFAANGAPGVPACFKAWSHVTGKKTVLAEKCGIWETGRTICGSRGIQMPDCLAMGCCFQPAATPGVPFCYRSRLQLNLATKTNKHATEVVQKCAVPDGERKECGFSTITATECHSRGCCFQRAKMNGAPWCFFASSVMASTSTSTTSTIAASATPHIRDENSTASSHHSSQTTSTSYHANTSSTTTTHPNMELIVANDAVRPSQPSRHVPMPTAQDNDTDTIVFARAAKPSRQPRSGNQAQVALLAIVGWALTSSSVYILVSRCFPGRVREAKFGERGEQHEEQPLTSQSPTTACQSIAVTTITQLDPTDQLFEEIRSHFESKWDTKVWPSCQTYVPSPTIANIFQLNCELHRSKYMIKQQELVAKGVKPHQRAGAGNEKRRFHGTRLLCNFHSGSPCQDSACNACRIVERGHFKLDRAGAMSKSKGYNPNMYGDGIYFTSWAHTAKGYGMAPGNTPPPKNLKDFVDPSAGNAVFVVDVLVGDPEMVTHPIRGRLPQGKDSRVVNKATGIDELVVFEESQALPIALLTFKN
mmetsp:Transcript_24946/g.48652  ORF Transcript_24946/g.48652 Transcript_24946/m.48652 type:complete len:684 (-) Transcript_24946:450-2501(-)